MPAIHAQAGMTGSRVIIGVVDTGTPAVADLVKQLSGMPHKAPVDTHGHATIVCRNIATFAPDARVICYDSRYTAESIKQAVDDGCHIINCSFCATPSDELLNAVNYAVARKRVVVAGAGNWGNTVKCYPAMYENAISTGAYTRDGTIAGFSYWGDDVTCSAPGENGTSTACAVTSAIIACGLSKRLHDGFSALTFNQTKDVVKGSWSTNRVIYAPVFVEIYYKYGR